MTPTLFGRWQTRIFLLATVGILVTFPLVKGFVGVKPNENYFWVVFYVGLFGIAWDVIYDFLQKFMWDHDWPGVFQLFAGIVEGIVLGVLINLDVLPNLPADEFVLGVFVLHYSVVWVAVYAASWIVMRLLFPISRFRGGEWIGRWHV
ncbi:hypothetical protein BCD67_04050 [Oscillatoriales cyanobacterium USR001]|nr:hypothetical protein BCD67_04050 [Oscillatoriales cyanobacterium USR001]